MIFKPILRLPIRQRILWAFGISLALVLLVRGFHEWVELQRRDRLQTLMEEYQRGAESYLRVVDSLNETSLTLREALEGKAPEAWERLRQGRERIAHELAAVRALATAPEIQAAIDESIASYADLTESTDLLVATLADPGSSQAAEMEEIETSVLEVWIDGTEFMQQLSEVFDAGADEFESEIDALREAPGPLGWIDTGLHVAAAFLIAALLFRLARSITKPVARLTEGVEQFARGDLSPDLPLRGSDEFARLATCFRDMAAELRRMLAESKGIADVASSVSSTLEIDAIAHRLIRWVRDLTRGERITLIMDDPAREAWVRFRTTPTGEIVRSEVPEFSPDDLSPDDEEGATVTRSLISVPLVAQGTVVGSLDVRGFPPDPRTSTKVNQIAALLVTVSMALRNAQMVEALRTERDSAAQQARDLATALEEIAHAQEFRTRFVGRLADQLRVPLAAIRRCARTMLSPERAPSAEEDLRDLETITRNTGDLLAIVERMHRFADLESGVTDLRATDVDLRAAVQDTLGRLRPTLSARSVSPRVSVADDLRTWRTDRETLRQALHHLIDHAVTWGGATEIAIDLSRDPSELGGLVIAVTDDGRAVPEGEFASLFEPFALKDGEGTTGLRLAIAATCVERLGGEITPRARGGGSEFQIWLPPEPPPAD